MESLYNSLHDLEDPELRLYFFKVHIVYSLLHCQKDPTAVDSLELCISLYNERIKEVILICYD